TAPRETFLERVRQAVRTGNRSGHVTALALRGSSGYHGAGPDPAARFCDELAAAGGHAHRVPNSAAALARVLELIRHKSVERVLLGRLELLDALDLRQRLHAAGVDVVPVDTLTPDSSRQSLLAADLSVASA